MDARERTKLAITITREILTSMMDDAEAVMVMTLNCIKPEDVENQVAMILEYLDKTAPEADAKAEEE